jgi:hypothetical protein
MAREAVTMEDAVGWHAHVQVEPAESMAIEERLKAMPAVDEDEYHLPSTKFDVITVVVETLSARAEADGINDVRFTPGDYS